MKLNQFVFRSKSARRSAVQALGISAVLLTGAASLQLPWSTAAAEPAVGNSSASLALTANNVAADVRDAAVERLAFSVDRLVVDFPAPPPPPPPAPPAPAVKAAPKPVAVRRSVARTPVAPLTGDSRRAAVLDCIARHEGSPAYSNGIGTTKKYRGRYQFGQDSWDNVARKFGRPDLAGVDVASASPADQDDMAWRYFLRSGYGPWPPSQGKCP